MNRALLVLFAVASLAGCSESTAPAATEPISLSASKATQLLTITNNGSELLYYFYYVGEDGLTDFSLCAPGPTCASIPAHSSVNIRYSDLQNIISDSGVVTLLYWRVFNSAAGDYGTEPQTLHVSLK